MEEQSRKTRLLIISGMIGILGAILTAASDMVLLGRPVSASAFFELGTESMAGLAPWRITSGTFAGVFVLPLQLAGLIPVYYGLKPAGRKLSLTVAILAAHALIMGVAFHTSYAYIGSGWRIYHGTGSGSMAASELMKIFIDYWWIIIIAISAELLASSICYALAILKGKTLLPKWMALLNPFCIFLAMFPVIFFIPAPVGGYIAPAYLNLSTAVFIIFSTAAMKMRMQM